MNEKDPCNDRPCLFVAVPSTGTRVPKKQTLLPLARVTSREKSGIDLLNVSKKCINAPLSQSPKSQHKFKVVCIVHLYSYVSWCLTAITEHSPSGD